jgi:transcriptional regulator with XRE-family HTH domain
MPILVDKAQAKIKEILEREDLSVKKISSEKQLPYTTVRDVLHTPGRLNVPWLDWYAGFFGTTTDYLLSRDNPNKETGENFRLARENADLSLKESCGLLGISEYALRAIEAGEMEAPLSIFKKAIGVYQVPPEYILGTEQDGQGNDAEIFTSIFRDIKFLLTCQDIHKRPQMKKLFSMLRVLSDDELSRLSRVVEPLLHECFMVR